MKVPVFAEQYTADTADLARQAGAESTTQHNNDVSEEIFSACHSDWSLWRLIQVSWRIYLIVTV